MENVKESEISLGLALGIAIRRVESCSNNGAGANANSRSRIGIDTIVEPRPLTELVWSRQKGLSIKCAGCTSCVTDMKPCILSPAAVGVSPFQDHEKHVDESHSGEICHSVKSTIAPLLESNFYHTDENFGELKSVPFIKMGNFKKGKEKACVSGSKSIPVDDNVAGTSEGPQNRRTADLLPLLATEPENIGLPLKMQDVRVSARPLSDLQKEGSSCSAPPIEKIEETAENDVIVKDVIPENSRRCVENLLRDEEGSMESCNSANLMSKGSKRLRFEQPFIIGSKRIKKRSQEYPVVKQDSSFMNWISNMVKGVKPYQEEGRPIADDDKALNFENKRLGFQTVFESLNSQDAKRLETKTQIENNGKSSKEIILFGKTPVNDRLNQKAFGNLWITRLSPKTASTALTSNNNSLDLKATHDTSAYAGSKQFKKPVALTSSYNDINVFSDARPITTHSNITCGVCGKMDHELLECIQPNENNNVFFKKKASRLNEVPTQISTSSENNKLLNEEKILRIPKGMSDTIRRLRLSRTDILKWMNSRIPIANLDGYFLRLRLSKWEEKVGEAGYYVACIMDENPSKGSKKPIRVSVGGIECLVETRYISNCDFLEDELVKWWQTTLLANGGGMVEESLISKLEERKKLGF